MLVVNEDKKQEIKIPKAIFRDNILSFKKVIVTCSE